MKILVAGAGSIGLRHARVLREAGHDVAIQTARPEAREALRRDGWRVIDAVADFAGCRHAIVATRTSLHPATAIPLLEAGMDLLVEKPLAVDGREGARLANEARRLGRKVWCGLNLRFCRSLNLFRRERERVGRLHAAQVECRSYLPDWRPGSDFRTSYSASSAEGGVLRDLVHEIDYAGWILGWPQRVFARFDFGGRLGIAAEEAASLDAVLAEGTSVQIGLDYLTRVPMRRMRLFGSEGVLSWDGITHEVAFAGPGGLRENWEDRETKDENLLCQDLAFLEGTDDRLVSAEEALRGLAVCDAARRSAASGHDEPVILP